MSECPNATSRTLRCPQNYFPRRGISIAADLELPAPAASSRSRIVRVIGPAALPLSALLRDAESHAVPRRAFLRSLSLPAGAGQRERVSALSVVASHARLSGDRGSLNVKHVVFGGRGRARGGTGRNVDGQLKKGGEREREREGNKRTT